MSERYGHPYFYELTQQEGHLYSDKNHDYAAGGNPLGNFDRVAGILAQYPQLDLGDPLVVLLVYTLKQLDAVLWGLAKGLTHKVEGLEPRLMDISVYAKIAQCILRDARVERT